MQLEYKYKHFFSKTTDLDLMKRFFVIAYLFLISFMAAAGPARPGKILLQQPDGTSFYARIYGDEHMKIKTTASGEAIIQDEEGWWCYAEYDSQARKTSSGFRVGSSVSSAVLGASRQIPFEILSRRASDRRHIMERNRIFAAQSLRKLNTTGEGQKQKAGLVILAQFQDLKFRYTKQDFEKLLTQAGYSVNGATGSAKEYFDDQFHGMYEFSFDVSEIVTLDNDVAYYGGNDPDTDSDKRPHKMVIEACRKLDNDITFSKYDQDGDGQVDNVFVFFAGEDEAAGAGDDRIWSHAWYVKDGAQETLRLDDVLINRYACTAELEGRGTGNIAGIGTFCHEYAHTLGLPDFYDTDYNEGGYSASLWQSTALMDAGNYNNRSNTPPYFNAIEREMLGISAPVVITSAGKFELTPINDGLYYRINTSQEGEYFLVEYRDGRGWDMYVGGDGMLVYHIDKSKRNAGYSPLFEREITAELRWWYQVEINALASRQCADLLEADGRKDAYLTYDDEMYYSLLSSVQGLFYPYGSVNSLTPLSTPGLKCWDDSIVEWGITDIKKENGKMTFRVVKYSEEELPAPVNVVKDVFQNIAIISFESSDLYEGNAKIEYGPTSGQMQTIVLPSYKEGFWAFVLEGLEPMTSYSLKIAFEADGAVGDEVETSFMTKRSPKNSYPYIYLESVTRNEDGTFPVGTRLPLIVSNASEAEDIKWSFNGTSVSRGDDGYYTVSTSGRLCAKVYWEDGSVDVIVKEIKVK